MKKFGSIVNIAVYSLIIFLFLSVALIAWGIERISFEIASQQKALVEAEEELIAVEQRVLQKDFERVISDILISKDIVERYLEDEINTSDLATIEKQFASIAQNKKIYDQMRYIDEFGQEIVRVDMEDGRAVVVEANDLQNKISRYYVVDAMAVKRGQIYISRLDLNIEHGIVEQPPKPMLRIATPVYDNEGNQRGIVINNYYAQEMIDDVKSMESSHKDRIYLINQAGYYINNRFAMDSEFAFMYNNKKDEGFFSDYPQIWKSIINAKQKQIKTADNMFFARVVIPFDNEDTSHFSIPLENIILGEGNLWLVSQVSRSNHHQFFEISFGHKVLHIISEQWLLFLLTGIVSLNLGLLFYRLSRVGQKIIFNAERDQLTKVLNRRAGMETAKRLLEQSKAVGNDVCLTFIDINGLKTVNDNLGHKAGDALISSFSGIMSSIIRTNDVFFRYGGDEFLLFQANMNVEQSRQFWQRIIEIIARINSSSEYEFNISVSHGISIIRAEEDDFSLQQHIEIADQNMYTEKEAIKKEVVILK